MSPEDAVCVALLWETSSPAARSRYLREERCGVPAHDPWVPRVERTDPRDYWAACAQCGRPIVVEATGGPQRRYCRPACRQMASDRRNPERRRASQLAQKQAERARRRAVAA